jgi:hypothetical protein
VRKSISEKLMFVVSLSFRFLTEIDNAMSSLTSWKARLKLGSKRKEYVLDTFIRRLDQVSQDFMVCSYLIYTIPYIRVVHGRHFWAIFGSFSITFFDHF